MFTSGTSLEGRNGMKTGDYTQSLQGTEYIALVSVRVCYNPGVSPQDVEDQSRVQLLGLWEFRRSNSGLRTQGSGTQGQRFRDCSSWWPGSAKLAKQGYILFLQQSDTSYRFIGMQTACAVATVRDKKIGIFTTSLGSKHVLQSSGPKFSRRKDTLHVQEP